MRRAVARGPPSQFTAPGAGRLAGRQHHRQMSRDRHTRYRASGPPAAGARPLMRSRRHRPRLGRRARRLSWPASVGRSRPGRACPPAVAAGRPGGGTTSATSGLSRRRLSGGGEMGRGGEWGRGGLATDGWVEGRGMGRVLMAADVRLGGIGRGGVGEERGEGGGLAAGWRGWGRSHGGRRFRCAASALPRAGPMHRGERRRGRMRGCRLTAVERRGAARACPWAAHRNPHPPPPIPARRPPPAARPSHRVSGGRRAAGISRARYGSVRGGGCVPRVAWRAGPVGPPLRA